VGSAAFVQKIQPLILSRSETHLVATENGMWVLQVTVVPYGGKNAAEKRL